ncbi:MAG: hypothetical protein WBN55_07720 [Eudoraea sp.]|uniref:hypothetical protein n=1 Tax=Eudoraea sp. TaxID=1979955 RepID=UPI003C742AF1
MKEDLLSTDRRVLSTEIFGFSVENQLISSHRKYKMTAPSRLTSGLSVQFLGQF